MLLIKLTIPVICNVILQTGREQHAPKEHMYQMETDGLELYRSSWTKLWSNQRKDPHAAVRRNSLTSSSAPSSTGTQFSSVQSLSCVWLFVTPWTAAHQASLSITNSRSLLKLMSTESVMPSNHLLLCHPLLLLNSIFPSIRSFPMSQFFAILQNIGVSASASVLPMNIQDWFPLGWTGWISLNSKGLSRVFSNTTVQKHQFFGT